jgi:hypothetical protein
MKTKMWEKHLKGARGEPSRTVTNANAHHCPSNVQAGSYLLHLKCRDFGNLPILCSLEFVVTGTVFQTPVIHVGSQSM